MIRILMKVNVVIYHGHNHSITAHNKHLYQINFINLSITRDSGSNHQIINESDP